ncbi:Ig-like domain repeat protein [Corynebacterium mendelii]|uniref:Ig-like domain repeat protein n=1 Tax=Corynebacterium mendelii TaxID=2765362 RepID=A0A939ITQ5_9CORY|nr:Ig-like domain-containing protein [Corynebacterium mendelii]MBN9644104.1 Ig-like domain repeat protein [Corynebacterium mendelii]
MTISSLKRRMKAATATVTALATAAMLAVVPSATANAANAVEVPVTFKCDKGVSSFKKTFRVTAPKEVALGSEFNVLVEPDRMAVEEPSWNMGYTIQAISARVARLDKATVDSGSMEGLKGVPQAQHPTSNFGQYSIEVKSSDPSKWRQPYGLEADGVYKHANLDLAFTATKPGTVEIKTGGFYLRVLKALFWESKERGIVLCKSEPDVLATVTVLKAGEKPSKINTSIGFINGDAQYLPAEGGETDLSVRVLTTDGNPVTGGTVTFEVDGVPHDVKVSADGTAVWKKKFPPNTSGEDTTKLVTVVYEGNEEFAPQNSLALVTIAKKTGTNNGDTDGSGATVTKVPTSIEATAERQALIAGSPTVGYTLSATVKADNNDDLADGRVVFTDGTRILGTVRLNSGGTGSVNVPLSANSSHTITAAFQKLSRNKTEYTESETTIKIDVPATPKPDSGSSDTAIPAPELKSATLSLNTNTTTVSVGDTTTVTATYNPSAGKKQEQTVFFRLDGVQIANATTDASGNATVDIPITVPGSHEITAVVAQQSDGDTTVASAESGPVIVSTPRSTEQATSTALKVSPSGTVGLGTPITMTAEIDGAADGESWVSFYDGGTLLADAKVTDGKASYTFIPSDKGRHALKATFNGAVVGGKNLQASESAEKTIVVSAESGRKSFVVEPVAAPETGGGAASGSSMDSLGAAKIPLIIVGVLTGILFIAGIIFLIPDVRRMANLPPIPPLFPVPNMG